VTPANATTHHLHTNDNSPFAVDTIELSRLLENINRAPSPPLSTCASQSQFSLFKDFTKLFITEEQNNELYGNQFKQDIQGRYGKWGNERSLRHFCLFEECFLSYYLLNSSS
jgi:hypothetical protein